MKIFIVGYMASGKSGFGKKLANKINFRFLDLDNYINIETQKSSADWIREKGEMYFRKIEHEMLVKSVSEDENIVISCGGGTPCFYDNMEFMNHVGITIWLNISEDHIFSRLSANTGDRPMFPIKNGNPDRELFSRQFNDRCLFYQKAKFVVKSVSLMSVINRLKSIGYI